jgi:hypothetical protein
MPPVPPKPTREERLAAQLRANLRRRKEQARAQSSRDDGRRADDPPPDPSQTE